MSRKESERTDFVEGTIEDVRRWLQKSLGISHQELVFRKAGQDRRIDYQYPSDYGPIRDTLYYDGRAVFLRSRTTGQTQQILAIYPNFPEQSGRITFETLEEFTTWKAQRENAFRIDSTQLPNNPQRIIEQLSEIPVLIGDKTEIEQMLSNATGGKSDDLTLGEKVEYGDYGGNSRAVEEHFMEISLDGLTLLKIKKDLNGNYTLDIAELIAVLPR